MAQRDGYGYEKASNTSEIQTKRIPAPIDINNILFHIVDKFHFNYVKIDKRIYINQRIFNVNIINSIYD